MALTQDVTAGAGLGATVGSVVPGVGTAIGAGVGALGGLALGGIEYLWNKNKAQQDEKNRPIYKSPNEIGQGLSLAEQQALQGVPQETQERALSNLYKGQSHLLGENQTRKGGLSNIEAISEDQNRAFGDWRSQDALARQAKMPALYAQLGNVADNKQMEWQLNKENPFYEQTYNDRANRGALFRNVGNAAQLGMYGGMGGNGQKSGLATNNNLTPDQIGTNMTQSQFNVPNTSYAPTTQGFGTMAQGLGWGS